MKSSQLVRQTTFRYSKPSTAGLLMSAARTEALLTKELGLWSGEENSQEGGDTRHNSPSVTIDPNLIPHVDLRRMLSTRR